MRILVVEDEERLARLISRVLTEEGYAVETETNGWQTLVRALAGEYDLLIVDWMLPELSGVRMVKRLRAAEVATPAIMLTAGGTITAEGRIVDRRVEATVKDTGPGIAPENLNRIFERFFRADTHSAARTRRPSCGGTGLGLAIARDLARAQGGELIAGNADEGGAIFTLTLPA